MPLSRSALATVIAFSLAATGNAQTIPSTGIAVSGMESYDRLAASLLTNYQIPGGAIAVARNGKLVFARGYGYANTATGDLLIQCLLHNEASVTRRKTLIVCERLERVMRCGTHSVGAQAMRTLLGGGRPPARRDQLRPVSADT
jgi:hypothetical protein